MHLPIAFNAVIRTVVLHAINVSAVEVIEHVLHYVRMYREQTDHKSRNSLAHWVCHHFLNFLLKQPEQIADKPKYEG